MPFQWPSLRHAVAPSGLGMAGGGDWLARPAMPPPAPRVEAALRMIGFAVALMAMIVLAGWALGQDSLMVLLPGFAVMLPGSALALLLGGLSLGLTLARPGLAAILALMLLALSLQALLQTAAGLHLGGDGLLFGEAVRRLRPQEGAGRLPLAPGLCFALLALGLLIGPRARGPLGARAFVLASSLALMLSGATLVGLALEAAPLPDPALVRHVTAHSSLATAALAIGLLLLRLDLGWMRLLTARDEAGTLLRRLLPLLVAAPIGLAWLFQAGTAAGLYDQGFGLALMVLSTVLLLAAQLLHSARRLSRDALRRAELLELLDMTATMVRDPDGTIRHWSAGNARMFGISATEALGHRAQDLLRTTFPRPVALIELELLRHGQWHGTLEHQLPDGRRMTVATHWALQRAPDGTPLSVTESHTDLTERIAAEAALADRESLLRLYIDRVPVGIAVFDREMRYLAASRRYIADLELPVEAPPALIGRSHYEVLESSETARDIHRRVLAGETLQGEEAKLTRADGREDWLRWEMTPWHLADGGIGGALLVCELITARKQAEQAATTYRKELERSNADLDEFAYVASHDLKAPLRAVSHLAQWIGEDLGGAIGGEARQNLDLLRQRVARMQSMLDGLLAFSRLSRATSDAVRVDTGAMLREIVDLLAPPPGFTVMTTGPMPVIHTQRVPLMHVLQNLVGNAMKHHDRDFGSVVVSVRRLEKGLVEFRVEDDGPGIPRQFHDKIFVIFQTLVARDEVEASGIGLAIVKKAVERHGGQVWVESTPPLRGTAFVFTWRESV
jgi:PAS domain S-box-containing protein